MTSPLTRLTFSEVRDLYDDLQRHPWTLKQAQQQLQVCRRFVYPHPHHAHAGTATRSYVTSLRCPATSIICNTATLSVNNQNTSVNTCVSKQCNGLRVTVATLASPFVGGCAAVYEFRLILTWMPLHGCCSQSIRGGNTRIVSPQRAPALHLCLIAASSGLCAKSAPQPCSSPTP